MHTVDVLIPTYNPKSQHLAEALAALQAQRYQQWHALIHDDCSTVDVAAMVEPYMHDARFSFMRSNTRRGIGGNWNACAKLSSSPIVAYLFQDDVWNDTYLENAVQILQKHPHVGFVSMAHEYRGEGGMTNLPLYESLQEFRRQKIEPGLHDGRKFLQFWVENELTPNIVGEPDFVVMRRSVMEKAGPFLEDMPQFLDTEYWLRLLTLTNWYNLRDKDYGVFRVHPSAASAQNDESGQGLFDRLRCFERVTTMVRGPNRRLVIDARNHAIGTMVEKFFGRVYAGKKTSTKGGKSLLLFCMKHPIVIGIALLRYVLQEVKMGLRGGESLR